MNFRNMNQTALLLAALLTACAGRQSSPSVRATPALPWVVLVRSAGDSPSTDALVSAISKHNTVRELSPVQATTPHDRAREIRRLLKSARQDYFTTYIDQAQAQLKRALRLAQETFAVGLQPKELAEIHLYLAAVSHAKRESDTQRHLDAAIRYVPTLDLDPNLFSPQLRGALETRRSRAETAEIGVKTTPPDATISWDGGPDQAPLPATPLGKGPHFLVARHPLFKVRRERVVVSTAAQLELTLELAAPGQIVSGLRRHPELAETGLKLLGVSALVWIEPTATGTGLWILTARGPREAMVPPDAPPEALDSIARTMVETSRPESARRSKPAPARSVWHRYWWAWTAVGVLLVGTAVALPLSLHGSDPDGRPVVMDLP